MSSIFPKWTNSLPAAALAVVSVGAATVVGGVWYYFTPSFWEVGYQPNQPVDYSHQIHVAKLGMDCRYCHSHVEESANANIPDTATCMNCHTGEGAVAYLNADLWRAHETDVNLLKVRTAFAKGEPIRWRRVHKLPDYVYFNHAAHINAGVSCYSCHGRVDQQAVVRQVENLSMGWCLQCHREPENSLVDTEGEFSGNTPISVTNLEAVQRQLAGADQYEHGFELAKQRMIAPPQSCGACHY